MFSASSLVTIVEFIHSTQAAMMTIGQVLLRWTNIEEPTLARDFGTPLMSLATPSTAISLRMVRSCVATISPSVILFPKRLPKNGDSLNSVLMSALAISSS
jgi:hypothetical protein